MKRLRTLSIFCISIAVILAATLAMLAFEGNTRTFVRIGSVEIPVEVARTPAEAQKGLSGRASLDTRGGMLFIFPIAAKHSFWMPDMHFPIDIIWINDGMVVDVSENVSNEFDPNSPIFYTPSVPAQYVLEVNAGFALSRGIKIGDPVMFSRFIETWPSK